MPPLEDPASATIDRAGVDLSIARVPSYDPATLRAGIERAIAPLGGLPRFVRPGQRVLLKPNLVVARETAACCNTHPNFILAVARMLRALDARPLVGDSPALGSAARALHRLGLGPAIAAGEFEVIEFHPGPTLRSTAGRCSTRLAHELAGVDAIINLPKLKTHQQIGMTCCVKNLFGCVVGRRKAWLHLARGDDEERFGAMLVDVARAVRPALHIVDAILCLERGGPIHGSPFEAGLVFAGTDAFAVDDCVFHSAGIAPDQICTHRAARAAGLRARPIARLDIRGVPLSEAFARPLQPPPHRSPIRFSPAHILRGWTRQFLSRIAPARASRSSRE